jgi:hypothetical protein
LVCLVADQGSRSKSLQIKSSVVKQLLCFRVGRQQDLKPPIEPKTVHYIRTDTSAYAVGSVKKQGINTRMFQVNRAGQASHPGPNNNYRRIDRRHMSRLTA